jgi:hypothetical protein
MVAVRPHRGPQLNRLTWPRELGGNLRTVVNSFWGLTTKLTFVIKKATRSGYCRRTARLQRAGTEKAHSLVACAVPERVTTSATVKGDEHTRMG